MTKKTLKEYNLKDWQVLHLKPKLKIFLDIPLCGYPAIYLYTHSTLEDIQKETIKIYGPFKMPSQKQRAFPEWPDEVDCLLSH